MSVLACFLMQLRWRNTLKKSTWNKSPGVTISRVVSHSCLLSSLPFVLSVFLLLYFSLFLSLYSFLRKELRTIVTFHNPTKLPFYVLSFVERNSFFLHLSSTNAELNNIVFWFRGSNIEWQQRIFSARHFGCESDWGSRCHISSQFRRPKSCLQSESIVFFLLIHFFVWFSCHTPSSILLTILSHFTSPSLILRLFGFLLCPLLSYLLLCLSLLSDRCLPHGC